MIVPTMMGIRYDSRTTFGTSNDMRIRPSSFTLLAFNNNEDDDDRSNNTNKADNLKVNVQLIPDVDATTLTAFGFGLIAFNFFVLGMLLWNMRLGAL
jgi:hypothetical protein